MCNLLLVFLLGSQELLACASCASAGGDAGFSSGLLNAKHFVGLSYRYLPFHADNGDIDLAQSDDRFHILSLQAAWTVALKWRLQASLPYRYNYRFAGLTPESIVVNQEHGIGDLLIGIQYQVLNLKDSTGKVRHRWSAGFALELPTGHFEPGADGSFRPANFQLGSGSWDIQLESTYSYQWKKQSLIAQGMYRTHSTNSDNYRFGDQMAGQVNYQNQFSTLWSDRSDRSLSILCGAYAEYIRADYREGVKRSATGSRSIFSNLGLAWTHQSLRGSVQWRMPLSQYYRDSSLETGQRLEISLACVFAQ